MNLRHFFAVCSLVILAGCATAPDSPGTASNAPLQPLSTPKPLSSKVAPLQAEVEQDLWDRIRQGFAIPDLEHELVQDRENWYSTRPEYIERMTQRSSRYLYHIVEELERRNMPTELALLPYIESAFNPQAVSSAKAAGMWQFMPSTGTYFDLTQNAFRDDRRDVLASTRAALDYLEKLHRMFGDWHLALAAYNWGEGSVGRAIKRNERNGLGTSYTELTMPAETRQYVPKLQAVKNIIARPEAFGIELPHIANHPYFKVVDLKRDMDVELIAKLADIRVADFKALNPSFNRPVVFAAGTTQILLPWDNAKLFQRNLEAYDDGQYASWTVWIAPSTMTVANAAVRVGMSEADLRSVNNIPPRMMIKAGSALMVPRTAQHLEDVATHIADNGRISFAPEITNVTRRAPVKVQKGDTMAKLAKRHGVTVANLARWNDIKPTAKLHAGQMLDVYKTVRVAAPGATGGRKATAQSSASSKRKAAPAPKKTAVAAVKKAERLPKNTPQKKGGTPSKSSR